MKQYSKPTRLAIKFVLVAFALAGFSSCSVSHASNQANTKKSAHDLFFDGAASHLSSLDYSQVIAGLDYASPHDDGAGFSFASPRELPDEPLTNLEERQLGVIHLDEDSSSFLFNTVMFSIQFAKRNGRLPKNGMELFKSNFSDDDALQEFLDMSPENQFRVAANGINVVTGKFFNTFEATEWQPGGLLIEPETNPEFFKTRFTGLVDAETSGQPKVWRVVVYGEKPGTILVDKYLAVNTKSRDFRMSREISSTVTPKECN